MPGENVLQNSQRLVTISQRLDSLIEDVRDLRTMATVRLERLEGHVTDIRERLARLEASRDAVRAQMQADLSRFKVEVERAEFRLSRRLSAPGEPPRCRAKEVKRAEPRQARTEYCAAMTGVTQVDHGRGRFADGSAGNTW